MPFDGATLPPQAAYLLRGKNYLLEHGWNHNGPGDERGSKSTGGVEGIDHWDWVGQFA